MVSVVLLRGLVIRLLLLRTCPSPLTLLRLLRVLRVLRVLRILRVLRVIRVLRILRVIRVLRVLRVVYLSIPTPCGAPHPALEGAPVLAGAHDVVWHGDVRCDGRAGLCVCVRA